MSPQLGILDLLRLQGFDRDQRRFKFVRHQQAGVDLNDYLRRAGWFEAYQAFQSRPIFHNIDFIVSFLGMGGTQARLIGVYKVTGVRPGREGTVPPGCPLEEHWLGLSYYYEIEKVSGFEELERRVVVEWGKGTRSWVQWPKKDKEVVEVLAKGQALPLFDDYLNFTLTHSELSYLYYDPEANREWRSRLRAVAGVYLILATIRGEQYVGSAYGIDVIWGRWSAYATDGHGGNKLLRDLISRDPSYPAAFSYSILQILPSTTVRTEVLRHEARYKEKLGSRAKRLSDDAPGGLNAN